MHDTTVYSYTSEKHTKIWTSYINDVVRAGTSETHFLNQSGNTDSTVFTYYSFFGQTRQDDTAIRYHYHDELGRDTLEVGYILKGADPRQPGLLTRIKYAGNEIDSIYDYGDQGLIQDKSKYENGNMVSMYFYNSGLLAAMLTNSFSNIPAGGFYGYTGNRQLQQSSSYVSVPPGDNATASYIYTFDKANRVTKYTVMQNNILVYIKEYTYY